MTLEQNLAPLNPNVIDSDFLVINWFNNQYWVSQMFLLGMGNSSKSSPGNTSQGVNAPLTPNAQEENYTLKTMKLSLFKEEKCNQCFLKEVEQFACLATYAK